MGEHAKSPTKGHQQPETNPDLWTWFLSSGELADRILKVTSLLVTPLILLVWAIYQLWIMTRPLDVDRSPTPESLSELLVLLPPIVVTAILAVFGWKPVVTGQVSFRSWMKRPWVAILTIALSSILVFVALTVAFWADRKVLNQPPRITRVRTQYPSAPRGEISRIKAWGEDPEGGEVHWLWDSDGIFFVDPTSNPVEFEAPTSGEYVVSVFAYDDKRAYDKALIFISVED